MCEENLEATSLEERERERERDHQAVRFAEAKADIMNLFN